MVDQEVLARRAAASKRYRDRLRAAGLCAGCGRVDAAPGKKKCLKCLRYHIEWARKNKHKVNCWNRAHRVRVRAEVIEKYGGYCSCCGEDQIEFLAIDHKNGDGNKERRALFGTNSRGSSPSWYLKLRREKRRKDLRVLCHNCNTATAHYGICPHQKAKKANAK